MLAIHPSVNISAMDFVILILMVIVVVIVILVDQDRDRDFNSSLILNILIRFSISFHIYSLSLLLYYLFTCTIYPPVYVRDPSHAEPPQFITSVRHTGWSS